jgi:hypothetical protein
LEIGVANDEYRPATLERGLFGRREFRENRSVDEGRYLRSIFALEYQPDISAEFVKPGTGARFLYERGDGELDYQRAELRVVGREHIGPIIVTARSEVGAVFGKVIPSQQLFELGQQQNLPGYGDKEFAGSRAAITRLQLMYITPFLRQPIRLSRTWMWPGLNPGFSVGLQAGWAEAPNQAARESIERLRPLGVFPAIEPLRPIVLPPIEPLSRPTEKVRTTVSAGLRLFSGMLFFGFARPIDQSAPWKFTTGGTF